MDKIKVGDFVKISDWDKFFEVVRVTSTEIVLISDFSHVEYKYSKVGYNRHTWIIRDKVTKKKSGFGKWVKSHGI